VKEEPPVVLDFPDPGPFDKPIVRCTNVSFGYAKPKSGGDEDSDDDAEAGGQSAAADALPPVPAANLLTNVDFQVPH
jgi:hypothetical protein